MTGGAQAAKDAVVDPDMPAPARRAAAAAVDNVVPEVKDFLLEAVTSKIRKKLPDDGSMTAPAPPCCPSPLAFARAHVLYHMFPHDKSLWASSRDPWWWLYSIVLGAFPLWGINTAWWFVVFLCEDPRGNQTSRRSFSLCSEWFGCRTGKDWRDEFQLSMFVITSRGRAVVAAP